MMSHRRVTREKVLQALYAYELSRDPVEHIAQTVLAGLEADERMNEFARALLSTTIDHHESIDKLIREKVTNWDFSRIALIDRLILRMSITEFLYFSDIPPKVTIDEAIEIAKRFSTDESGKFVNGVLNAVLAELKADGSLKKTGRGLLGLTLPEPAPRHSGKGKKK